MKKILMVLVMVFVLSISYFTFAAENTDYVNNVEVKNYKTFMRAINNLSDNTSISGKAKEKGLVVIDLKEESLDLTELNNIEFKNIVFKNLWAIEIKKSTNIRFENVTIKNSVSNGISIEDSSNIEIVDSTFKNIGSEDINPTWQGNGVYANSVDNLVMKNNEISKTYGHGGIFILDSTNFVIDSNNIHDTAYRAVIMYDGTFTGVVKNNDIYDIGSINPTDSGVGANGIYGHGDDLYGVSILDNRITNVLENGIEGGFGLVEGNYINGTGIDLENFPTPSTEGIYANGLVYRNNIVKNTKKAGIKLYSETTIENLEISNNQITQEFEKIKAGIALIAEQGYSNVLIKNNTITNYEDDIAIHNDFDNVVEIINNEFIASN